MDHACPHCLDLGKNSSEVRRVVRHGGFYRKSDSRFIGRFRCLTCGKTFSQATGHPCFGQNKRQLNIKISRLLTSNVSQRRTARLLGITRKTVAKKLIFLGIQARLSLMEFNRSKASAKIIQFDDLETIEHTKCKPVSITLAVEEKTRRILSFQVAQMPAKGPLAAISRKKYGRRKDMRKSARIKLFKELLPLVEPTAEIKSDQNPHYGDDVKKYFPRALHSTFKGRKGAITGQGELKKIGFDPIFSLNHTCAMFRANINRLNRKTWCTTKKMARLADHVAIYALYHNTELIEPSAEKAQSQNKAIPA
jgi:transposase-like protein